MVGEIIMAVRGDREKPKKVRDKSPEKMQRSVLTWVIVMLFLIVGFLAFSLIRPKDIGSAGTSYIAREGKIEQKVETEAIIVRDERVVITSTTGIVHYLVEDNAKVPASTNVVEMLYSEMSNVQRAPYTGEEQNINNFISSANLEKSQHNDMLIEVRVQIATKESQMQAYEGNGDNKNATRLSKEILDLEAHEIDILNEIARIDSDIKEATKRLEDISRAQRYTANDVINVIKNSEPSIISRKTDGLEHILRPGNPDILDYVLDKKNYAMTELQDNSLVYSGTAVFREINSFQTFVLVQIKAEEEDISKDARISVRFHKLATEAVSGTIVDYKLLDEGKSTYSALIALDRFAMSLVDYRVQDCEVIIRSFSGIVVKNSCITQSSGVSGVMRLVGSKYEFAEVSIVGSNSDESVITGIKAGDKVLLRP